MATDNGSTTSRPNELLENFFGADPDTPTPTRTGKKRPKSRRVLMSRDYVKRRAFRVLAAVADLDAPARRRVLEMAAKLSGA